MAVGGPGGRDEDAVVGEGGEGTGMGAVGLRDPEIVVAGAVADEGDMLPLGE